MEDRIQEAVKMQEKSKAKKGIKERRETENYRRKLNRDREKDGTVTCPVH